MIVVICGDRHWTDRDKIYQRLLLLPFDAAVVHGDCPTGADRIADQIAREMGFVVVPVPADWTKYGLSAGPIRNSQMIAMGPWLVIAFHSDINGKSKGTKDCVNKARARGIPVEIIT